MVLAPGARIGPYEITACIGAGGMGEVYRARDPDLDRDVAIKVLLDEFACDPEWLSRFEREAKTLASLNHPNIAVIHRFEEADGVRALVMELVEGPTLADRIADRAIPVDEALSIAKQIAEALEAAHENAVVHRDLKPANIKVRPDGTVKVLDFGLAKVSSPLASSASTWSADSPTLPRPADRTHPGVLLGTAPYMSPEQIRGAVVDKRADIWAFGCVLYELLSGRPAFSGDTTADTLAKVLDREPEWQVLRPETPIRIRRMLQRCLEKDSRRRVRDIGEVRIEIEDLRAQEIPASIGTTRADRFGRWSGVVLVALAAGALGWYVANKPRRLAGGGSARFAVELPFAAPTFPRGLGNRFLALSPDGTHLAFMARQSGQTPQLWLRALDRLDSQPISGSEAAFDPFFSYDGRWLGFFVGQRIKKVLVTGGEPLTVCDTPAGDPLGASWGPDDTIFFSPSRDAGLWRVPAAGGVPEAMFQDEGLEYRLPQVLPNGQAVLFTSRTGGTADRTEPRIYLQSLRDGERREIIQGVGAHLANDYLIFSRGTSVLAVRFDADRLETVGTPLPLVDRVAAESVGIDAPQVSVSRVGSLAYIPAVGREDGALTWVDRNGIEEALPAPIRPYFQPRLSPDGKRLAVLLEPILGSISDDLWTYDFSRDLLASVTVGGGHGFPVWGVDGRLTFLSSEKTGRPGIYRKAAGSAPDETLLSDRPGPPLSWSPDGRMLAFVRTSSANLQDLWILPLEEGDKPGEPRPFVQTRFAEGGGVFSPDGRWVAYVSNETGRNEVYVQAVFGTGGRLQISSDGGNEPVWPRKARGLFYRTGDLMMEVDLTTTTTFAAGKPRRVFEGQYAASTALWPNYDVTADARRFLMIKPVRPSQARAGVINVVLNWPEELGRRGGPERE